MKIIKVNILYVPRNKSLNEKMSQNYSTEYKKGRQQKGLRMCFFLPENVVEVLL